MKDFFGLPVKVDDVVVYAENGKGYCNFKRGTITDIVGDRVKIKGLVKKRDSSEIISEEPYLHFIDTHPEFLI